MKKITVKNLVTGRNFGPIILEDSQAQEVIAKHKGNKLTWGREERVERMTSVPENAISFVEVEQYKVDPNTFNILLDDNGMPIVDTENKLYEVTLPKEYDLQIEDVTSELNAEQAWNKLYDQRERILNLTDFTQIADCPLESDLKRIFREYRQYLRDITSEYNDSNIINFNIKSFQSFYRAKYIEISNSFITKTEQIEVKINKILE